MNNTRELAERIYTYFDPWDLEYSSVDEIEENIKEDPTAVISFLLDTIENS